MFDYLHAVNDILTAAGVELPLPGQATSTPDTRLDRGRQVQERIVGAGRVEPDARRRPPDCKHFQRYLTGNCFGDTVARGGLDLPTRELLTFAMLAALGGADAQVRGHVTGNLNVGNTRARLLAVLTVLVPFIGYPRTLNALAAINDIAPPTVQKGQRHDRTDLAHHRCRQGIRPRTDQPAARSLRLGLVIGIVRISGGGWDVIVSSAETSLPG